MIVDIQDNGRSEIWQTLIGLQKEYNLTTFVETGTQEGSTSEAVCDSFECAYSIESDSYNYNLAVNRLKGRNVNLILGSSGIELPRLLITNKITKALFWLDAHGNEHDETAENQIPLELKAIKDHAPESLVAIDDVIQHEGKFKINDTYWFEIPEFWDIKHFPNMQIMILWKKP